MDKDLLRIVIILTGVVVIAGMLLWNVLKNRKKPREINFKPDRDPLENIDESLFLNTSDDDFDIVPLGSVNADESSSPSLPVGVTAREDESPTEQKQAEQPAIIQLGIVAKQDRSFKGSDLLAAFSKVGLEYGAMQIFERLNENQRVDFSVASMVEPGTFPADDLESFSSPGLAFFMQPGEMDDAVAVYDDLIETLQLLAIELDGEVWDSQRKPLTEQAIEALRQKLL